MSVRAQPSPAPSAPEKYTSIKEGNVPKKECDRGPVSREYGKTPWVVYGCSDNRTLVILSGPHSPATPFLFVVIVGENGSVHISGEGTGNKAVTDAALADIRSLSGGQIVKLFEETMSSRQPPKQ